MTTLAFDPDTTEFRIENAAGLARASLLAYDELPNIPGQLKDWGFPDAKILNGKSTQGFVCSNDAMTIVAFRGTDGFVDGLQDLDFHLIPGPFGGQVHHGFSEALDEVWTTVAEAVTEYGQGAAKSLWITGHSLGAALAVLTVARFRERDRPVDGLYTFGQPRVGDRQFARNFNHDFKPYAFRFVNNNDVVTRVPPRSLGYSHIGSLRYFKESGALVEDIGSWNRFLDRMHGRVADVFKWGTDGIKDHSMDEYLRLVQAAAGDGG